MQRERETQRERERERERETETERQRETERERDRETEREREMDKVREIVGSSKVRCTLLFELIYGGTQRLEMYENMFLIKSNRC